LAGASVIGLYISYATPIFLRITSGRERLIPGPFSLGRWYTLTGSIGVAWVAFIVVLLMFPSGSKTDAQDMNYAVVIIGGVFVLASTWWLVSARKWFHGPVPNVDVEPSVTDYDEKVDRRTAVRKEHR